MAVTFSNTKDLKQLRDEENREEVKVLKKQVELLAAENNAKDDLLQEIILHMYSS